MRPQLVTLPAEGMRAFEVYEAGNPRRRASVVALSEYLAIREGGITLGVSAEKVRALPLPNPNVSAPPRAALPALRLA